MTFRPTEEIMNDLAVPANTAGITIGWECIRRTVERGDFWGIDGALSMHKGYSQYGHMIKRPLHLERAHERAMDYLAASKDAMDRFRQNRLNLIWLMRAHSCMRTARKDSDLCIEGLHNGEESAMTTRQLGERALILKACWDKNGAWRCFTLAKCHVENPMKCVSEEDELFLQEVELQL